MKLYRSLFLFTKSEIDNAFKKSRTQGAIKGLKLLVSQSELSHGKILIIIPRAAGKAHDRNKLRRQTKSIFYENQLYTQQKRWILLVRKEAMSIDFEMLKQFIINSCKK